MEGSGEGATLGLKPAQDLHSHTEMSDGLLPLHEVVSLARERGLAIGIADHVSQRMPDRFVSSRPAVERYLAAIDRAEVLRAAELCWCDPFSHEMTDTLLQRCDYLIGSNHGFPLPDGSMVSPWQEGLPGSWAERPHEVMEIMVHNLCDLVRRMPISIVAHSTLLPKALLALDGAVETWWSPEREDRFIEAVVGAGVALEVSNRYHLPHERFLRKAQQAGARFTLGSDAHQAEEVARLDWATAAAAGAGITNSDLLVIERTR